MLLGGFEFVLYLATPFDGGFGVREVLICFQVAVDAAKHRQRVRPEIGQVAGRDCPRDFNTQRGQGFG